MKFIVKIKTNDKLQDYWDHEFKIEMGEGDDVVDAIVKVSLEYNIKFKSMLQVMVIKC